MLGRSSDRIPVAIFGAGGAGVQLALALEQGAEYSPILFLDDSPQSAGSLDWLIQSERGAASYRRAIDI